MKFLKRWYNNGSEFYGCKRIHAKGFIHHPTWQVVRPRFKRDIGNIIDVTSVKHQKYCLWYMLTLKQKICLTLCLDQTDHKAQNNQCGLRMSRNYIFTKTLQRLCYSEWKWNGKVLQVMQSRECDFTSWWRWLKPDGNGNKDDILHIKCVQHFTKS